MELTAKYETCIPDANNLLASLRDIGYTLGTAVADLIDNSITAGAREIRINAIYGGQSSVLQVIDDGAGMDLDALKIAMKLGARNPNDDRNLNDLGRFGLGLKTAAFSQGKKLTVISKKLDDVFVGRRWDLARIEKTNKWELEQISEFKQFEKSLKNHGTLVEISNLDRLGNKNRSHQVSETDFWSHLNEMGDHLGLVFHRYISGEPKLRKIKIFFNGNEVKAIDPFLGEFSGNSIPKDKHLGVTIQSHILPHHSSIEGLVSPLRYKQVLGEDGLNLKQGFYVYRNSRLIIWGTWFNIIAQTISTQLLKIQVDIPNTNDFEWKIDIKKSRATPPLELKDFFRSTLRNQLSNRSKRVYTQKGSTHSTNIIDNVWNEVVKDGRVSFQINRDSKLVSLYHDGKYLSTLLNVIESALPIDKIISRFIEKPDELKQSTDSIEVLRNIVLEYVRDMNNIENTKDDIIALLTNIDLFKNNRIIVEEIVNEIIESGKL